MQQHFSQPQLRAQPTIHLALQLVWFFHVQAQQAESLNQISAVRMPYVIRFPGLQVAALNHRFAAQQPATADRTLDDQVPMRFARPPIQSVFHWEFFHAS